MVSRQNRHSFSNDLTTAGCLTCRKRKVRCKGGDPCQNCSKMSITCRSSFDANLKVSEGGLGSRKRLSSQSESNSRARHEQIFSSLLTNMEPLIRLPAARGQQENHQQSRFQQINTISQPDISTSNIDEAQDLPLIFHGSPKQELFSVTSPPDLGFSLESFLSQPILSHLMAFPTSPSYATLNIDQLQRGLNNKIDIDGYDVSDCELPCHHLDFVTQRTASTPDTEERTSLQRKFADTSASDTQFNPLLADADSDTFYLSHYETCISNTYTLKDDVKWNYLTFIVNFI